MLLSTFNYLYNYLKKLLFWGGIISLFLLTLYIFFSDNIRNVIFLENPLCAKLGYQGDIFLFSNFQILIFCGVFLAILYYFFPYKIFEFGQFFLGFSFLKIFFNFIIIQNNETPYFSFMGIKAFKKLSDSEKLEIYKKVLAEHKILFEEKSEIFINVVSPNLEKLNSTPDIISAIKSIIILHYSSFQKISDLGVIATPSGITNFIFYVGCAVGCAIVFILGAAFIVTITHHHVPNPDAPAPEWGPLLHQVVNVADDVSLSRRCLNILLTIGRRVFLLNAGVPPEMIQ